MKIKKFLTNLETINYLLSSESGGEKMRGSIRTKEKCPVCKKLFQQIPKLGIICPEHKTIPKKYFIDIYFYGKRIKIYSHKSGRILDSYQLAAETLGHIQYEIRNHQFDPTRYVKSDINNFLFENAIRKWLRNKQQDAERNLLSWSYLNPVKGHINNYILPCFTGKDIRDIRNSDLKDFLRQLPIKLSPKTQKNIMGTLENFFSSLFQDEIIDKKLMFPKISVPEPETKWCDRETQDILLNAIPDEDKPIFFFLTRQGIRVGEAVAIKWEDIKLTEGILNVKRAMSCRKIVERTKTKRMRPRLIHHDILNILKSIPHGLPHTFLFINPRTKKPYLTDTLQRIWSEACKKVGVKIKLYEATRHSVASMAATHGVDLNIIKQVLGHTDIRTTQRYAHVDVIAQSHVFLAQQKKSPRRVPRLKTIIK